MCRPAPREGRDSAAREATTMTFHIITIFPDIFNSYLNESILKRAQSDDHIKIKIHNLRDWTTDKHKATDDTPYGGGAGMVMKVDVLYRAIKYITRNMEHATKKVVLLSAKGERWVQAKAKEYSKLDNIILICGRYEGVDERVTKFIDEEISIGDYVLTGGEIPAMAIIDSITRLLPDVLGNQASAQEESHSTPGVLEYPQYTRPEVFINDNGQEHQVPKVLLSGNHGEIEEWRQKQKKKSK